MREKKREMKWFTLNAEDGKICLSCTFASASSCFYSWKRHWIKLCADESTKDPCFSFFFSCIFSFHTYPKAITKVAFQKNASFSFFVFVFCVCYSSCLLFISSLQWNHVNSYDTKEHFPYFCWYIQTNKKICIVARLQ